MSEGEGITIYQISISNSQFPNPKQISMFNSYEPQITRMARIIEEAMLLLCIRVIRVIRGQSVFGFGIWDLGPVAAGSVTPKIITRPSIPRTSCGGSSSNRNESPARSRTAFVTSKDLLTVFVRPCIREAMFTVLPIAVNSRRCGVPTLPTIAGPECIPIPI